MNSIRQNPCPSVVDKPKSRTWSPAARAREAARIREHKPWLKSTGPRTAGGKARSARNADKGQIRPRIRELAQTLRRIAHSIPNFPRRSPNPPPPAPTPTPPSPPTHLGLPNLGRGTLDVGPDREPSSFRHNPQHSRCSSVSLRGSSPNPKLTDPGPRTLDMVLNLVRSAKNEPSSINPPPTFRALSCLPWPSQRHRLMPHTASAGNFSASSTVGNAEGGIG
jgi:hypothetical protein